MNEIKAVVFDWAGTMIDFGSCAPVEAMRAAFALEGIAASDAEIRAPMGIAKREHVDVLLYAPKISETWRKTHGAAPTKSDGDRIYAALEPLMQKAATNHATLIPGAAELVRHLRADGIKIGSCTGYTRTMMAGIIPKAAQQGYEPDCVVCAGETASGRPSPLMLWQNLVSLGVWPAKACVKVDDAEVGIEEGLNAGCWTVGVAASGNGVGLDWETYTALREDERRDRVAVAAASLKAAGAHFVIDTVADLPKVLAQISNQT
jgi:phosphonoacetaldehyde hydrolase